MHIQHTAAFAAAFACLTGTGLAQGPAFTSPGMPQTSSGQTDRFSNEFNPAIGGVLDLLGEWRNVDGGGDDGFDLTFRSLELSLNTWVDPNIWSYAILVADEDDVVMEEAAVEYVGFDDNSKLRAGRFYVDFGKQMQAHIHSLPYFERPGVLANYLGEELAGTGVQYDNWFSAGESSAVRFSLAVFESLESEGHGHGEEEHGDEEEEGAEVIIPTVQDLDEFNYTARVTGMHDVGETGVFQWGLSLRGIPEFTFEDDENGLDEDDFSNHVYGVDATYSSTDETGIKTWTVGGEFLLFDGDLSAEVDDPDGTPDNGDESFSVLDDDVSGYYLWLDRKWSEYDSAGILFDSFEHPEEGKPEENEVTLYYTRHLSDFSRLRFGVSYLDRDDGDDETAFLVQFTNFLGPHAHGLNW